MGLGFYLVFVALVATIGAAILRATVFHSWQGTYRKLLIGGLIGEVAGALLSLLIQFSGIERSFKEKEALLSIPLFSMLFGLIVQSLLIILRYGRSRKKRRK
jgi:hypothetical protein